MVLLSAGVVRAWQEFLIGRGIPLPKFGADGDFGKETAGATRTYQGREGLAQSGELDATTEARAASQGFRRPASAPVVAGDANFPPRPLNLISPTVQSQQDTFGRIEAVPAPVLGNAEAIRITNSWEDDNVITVVVPQMAGLTGGNKKGEVRWHRLGVPQLLALWRVWERERLLDRVLTFDGAYNPRYVRGQAANRILSNHAFAVAFDINAQWNWLDAVPAALGAPGCVRELVPWANRLGFYWGGHYTGRKDGMHFEIARILTAAEIAAV